MAEDKDSKTEEPTTEKLRKAREDGNVPISQEVKSTAMLLAFLLLIAFVLPTLMEGVGNLMVNYLNRVETIDMTKTALPHEAATMVVAILKILAFAFALFSFFALASNLIQTDGFLYTPKKLKLSFSSLNPISGFKRLFGIRKVALELGKGVVKLVMVGAMASLIVAPQFKHPEVIYGLNVIQVMAQIQDTLVILLFAVVFVMVLVAMADLAYVKWKHKRDLKMTKQEVKDERKNAEGDPRVKNRIRSIRMQRYRERMMSAIEKATVVVTNPTHFAVALHYEMGESGAPTVVAKGIEFLALKIREIAEEHDVPIIENPPLARALYATVEVDQEIPEEHYKAVAEIIGFIMRQKGKMQ